MSMATNVTLAEQCYCLNGNDEDIAKVRKLAREKLRLY